MINKLESIYNHFLSVEEKLSDPEIVSDMKKYSALNKEYKQLTSVVEVYKVYKSLLSNIKTAKEMLSDSDLDMQAMAKEELGLLEPEKETLEEKIKILLIPKLHGSRKPNKPNKKGSIITSQIIYSPH